MSIHNSVIARNEKMHNMHKITTTYYYYIIRLTAFFQNNLGKPA